MTDPETAGITVQSNDSSSALVGQISQQVSDIATNQLGHTITATYIEGVLAQSDVLKKQLGTAADGAQRLGEGATRLGDGATRLGDGADQLAGGLGQLSGGADRLAGGADRLAGGATRLQGGIGRLAGGAEQLNGAANQLAGGLGQLNAATDQFAGQAGQAGQIDTGELQQLGTGVTGLVQLAQGLQQACAADPALAQTMPELCQSANDAVAQAAALQGGLTQLDQLGSSVGQLNQGLPPAPRRR